MFSQASVILSGGGGRVRWSMVSGGGGGGGVQGVHGALPHGRIGTGEDMVGIAS